MRRGRPPSNRLRETLLMARVRGRAMGIVQNGDTPVMFVIAVDNTIIFVLIREGRLVPSHLEETEAENRVLRAGIRSIPGSADILREFRGYSRAGTLRFFRVENSMLLEIGRDSQLPGVKEQKAEVQESVKGNGGRDVPACTYPGRTSYTGLEGIFRSARYEYPARGHPQAHKFCLNQLPYWQTI